MGLVASGTRLGPYEIVSLIGSGGMGEVWRARDTRLDRSVAVKILTEDFARSSERRERFTREARTISQLDHPHICVLYDVGDDYLVMELLEGETLAERIARGALPLSEVVRYGAEIAAALDRAHRAGVVHRDVKPGNIMITRSGTKLLDFGLAKAAPLSMPASSAPAESHLVTQRLALTGQGAILGTFQYMAPEQLEGLDADFRTDIFALGEVLFEMATGNPAFEGKTKTSLIAAIVSADPRPISELRPLTPPALDHVIAKCLSKNPEDRWQSAHDVAEELKWIGATSMTAAAKHGRMRLSRTSLLFWLLAVAMAGALGAAMTWLAIGRRPAPILRLDIDLPPQTYLERAGRAMLTVSPDGSRVVYGAPYQGTRRLFLRAIDRFTATPIPGTERPHSPFFSPDGAWVGFFADGTLKKVSLSGGAPITICSVPNARGATWGVDQMIYFAPYPSGGIYKVSAGGGMPVQVSRPDPKRNELSHRWPQTLPGGTHLLATVKGGDIASFDGARIVALPVGGGPLTTILEGGMFATYLPTGHLIFARENGLYAVAFDARSLKVSGTPVRVIDGVLMWQDTGWAAYAVSSNGSLVYLPAVGEITWRMLDIDRKGVRRVIVDGLPNVVSPRLSPDERMIAIDVGAANDDIALVDLTRGMRTRLSFEAGNEARPIWTPDGTRVLYSSELPVEGKHHIVMRSIDGSGQPEELLRSSNAVAPWSVSPDGTTLAFVESTPSHQRDIGLLSLSGRLKTPLLESAFDETAPAFSPDGQWLAYESNESGRSEVYVRAVAAGSGRTQISIGGGSSPHWAKSGRELFYFNENAMHGVAIEAGTPLRAARPQSLFPIMKDVDQDYDVTADGHFLFPSSGAEIELEQIHYVGNFTADVKRRVSSK